MLIVQEPKIEYLTNPVCVPLDRVRFSWMVEASERDQCQIAYQILVKSEVNEEVVWDSGKTMSSDMAGITYVGKPLQPRSKYFLQVKVWSDIGESSEFCDLQSFETSLSSEK